MTSPQENEEKLEYAARLSGLLLNEATDVMRWFLKDNLPREMGGKPNLPELLRENRLTFERLRDGNDDEFGHEMFDILFPPHDAEPDEKNMEISLLFTLIRYLCEIKHPSWRWWDENPQYHQKVPVFDVIRMMRFKDKMKNIVHKYEVNKDTYEQLLTYLTGIIERLRGYRISARRWKDDVISYGDDEIAVKERKTLDFVVIMRWQTLPIEEREATYLVLKENFHKMKSEDAAVAWNAFISCFGQMKNLDLCKVNELQEGSDEHRLLAARANNVSDRCYLNQTESPAKLLNWHLVHDLQWKKYITGEINPLLHSPSSPDKTYSVKKAGDPPQTFTSTEKKIYSSIDDRVFISDSPSQSFFVTACREKWKRRTITANSHLFAFPFKEADKIHLDEVNPNISKVDGQPLAVWTDMFKEFSTGRSSGPLRIIISGPPCCGKTTLMRKIAYAGATKNSTQMEAYDLVFYIDLSNVQREKPYTRFSECIIQQCLDDEDAEITPDDLEGMLRSRNGSCVLFLFDNIEHFDICDETSEISDVIKSELWPECSIIITKLEGSPVADNLLCDPWRNWRQYRATGFTLHDVVKEARRVLTKGGKLSQSDVRHALNLIRIYQRDVYAVNESSPVLSSVICKAWKDASNDESDTKKMPETLGGALGVIFSSYFSNANEEDNQFEKDVLEATLNRKRHCFEISETNETALLEEAGVVREVNGIPKNTNKTVCFVHPILQNYFSARVYCSTTEKPDLRKYLNTPTEALALRHFLIFYCEQMSEAAEEILAVLSNLAQNAQKEGQIYGGRLIELCMRCFYVSSLNKDSRGHCCITSALQKTGLEKDLNEHFSEEAENSDLVTANLALTKTHKLSNRTKQSLLKFVRACRPGLTSSGTVFPLLRSTRDPRTTSYIKKLHISEIRPDQVVFTSAIISSLPFLDDISLTNVGLIKSEDFDLLCRSLKPASPNVTSPLHSLRITFKSETRFDLTQVPAYEALGSILDCLPFLESLDIRPQTYDHFISIYKDSNTVVPLKEIRLSRSDISEERCKTMFPLISRSYFVSVFDLSQNRIHGGLSMYYDAFRKFRTLQVINLQESCLSSSSLMALASCLTAQRLSSTVMSLNLRANHVDDEMALLSLAKSLGHLKSLRKLDLSQNFLRNRVICVLAAQLRNMNRLQELRLDYVQMGDVGFSALRSNISFLRELEVLSFGENPLENDAINLVSFLHDTKAEARRSLAEVKLSGISDEVPLHLTGKGLKDVTTALPHFTNLRILDLTHTKMEYSDAVNLLRAAEDHGTVMELILSDQLTPLTSEERRKWRCLQIVPTM